MATVLTEERPMATYVLPDDSLTAEQRKDYMFNILPEDAVEIALHVFDQFPAVFDDAVLNTGRVNRLATLRSKPKDTR